MILNVYLWKQYSEFYSVSQWPRALRCEPATRDLLAQHSALQCGGSGTIWWVSGSHFFCGSGSEFYLDREKKKNSSKLKLLFPKSKKNLLCVIFTVPIDKEGWKISVSEERRGGVLDLDPNPELQYYVSMSPWLISITTSQSVYFVKRFTVNRIFHWPYTTVLYTHLTSISFLCSTRWKTASWKIRKFLFKSAINWHEFACRWNNSSCSFCALCPGYTLQYTRL